MSLAQVLERYTIRTRDKAELRSQLITANQHRELNRRLAKTR